MESEGCGLSVGDEFCAEDEEMRTKPASGMDSAMDESFSRCRMWLMEAEFCTSSSGMTVACGLGVVDAPGRKVGGVGRVATNDGGGMRTVVLVGVCLVGARMVVVLPVTRLKTSASTVDGLSKAGLIGR